MGIIDWAASTESPKEPYQGALGISPWNLPADVDGGPRRGGIEDYGGARLEDEADPAPPRDGSHPYSDIFNGLQEAAVAADKVLASLIVTITLDNSGAPAISKVTSPSDNVKISSLTLVPNGAGDLSITWADGLLPPPVAEPVFSSNSTAARMSGAAAMHPNGRGVDVAVWDDAGTPADGPFTLLIW